MIDLQESPLDPFIERAVVIMDGAFILLLAIGLVLWTSTFAQELIALLAPR